LTKAPFVAPYANIFSNITKGAAKITSELGLSKPTTLAITDVCRVDSYAGLSNGKGLNLYPTLAMDPENRITTKPNVGGISLDEMDLIYVAGTPMLVYRLVVPQATTQVVVSTLDVQEYCYLDLVNALFKHHSGSTKLKIFVVASTFHVISVVFWLSCVPGSTNWRECYHQVMSITGDGEIEFTIPYLFDNVAIEENVGPIFQVMMTVLTWSQPDDAVVAPIELLVYKAGDSDMQWGALYENYMLVPLPEEDDLGEPEFKEIEVETHSNVRADFQKPFKPLHSSMTGYKHDKLIWGEQYRTFREVLHKWHAYGIQQTTVSSLTYDNQGVTIAAATDSWYVGVELIGAMFYSFYRGSMRLSYSPRGFTACRSVQMQDTGGFSIDCGTVSSSPTPNVAFEYPWYYKELYGYTRREKVNLPDLATTGDGSGILNFFVLKSAGDDFSFHFLTPPPVDASFGHLSSATPTLGYRALRIFLG